MRRVERQSKTRQYQEKRRLEALSRQRAWRRDLTAQARQLALSEQTSAASPAASQVGHSLIGIPHSQANGHRNLMEPILTTLGSGFRRPQP